MGITEQTNYRIPSCITDYLKDELGYDLPYSLMKEHILSWYNTWRAIGDFWDYEERDASGHLYKQHRMSVKPAKKVCDEWATLLMNEDTDFVTDDDKCNEYLKEQLSRMDFRHRVQSEISKAFALGTCGFSVEYRADREDMALRRYDARMIIPLSWDDDGVTECAFCTRTNHKGKTLEQLVMHVFSSETKSYHIMTAYFEGNERVVVEDVEEDFDTKGMIPWFALFSPAIENNFVDFSPYGQSIFADAVDVLQSVDIAYDAIFSEIKLGRMRIFMSDMMFETTDNKGTKTAIPFGKDDATIYRKVQSINEEITTFAPQLRIDQQVVAYRTAVQKMGDACGFGTQYFDIDSSGMVKTAYEVSNDNQTLSRNIKMHENALQKTISDVIKAALHCARIFLNESIPEEKTVTVQFDDSIIVDENTERQQDLAEVNVTMNVWEYRMKHYGEDEDTARENAAELMSTGYEQPFNPFEGQAEE